ncbi:MAG: DNA mismatch repair protein MutS [bacterium]|nr:DNA mismatch repair protein MutS [bacterium]
MMRQYLEAKARHPDAILFFRMGDFFEMFADDAMVASKALGLTLTSRNRNAPDELPMCGVPVHTVQTYINKMVELGFKVSVCDQTEDPKNAKGLVQREVIRVVTPGLNCDADAVQPRENNFLMGIVPEGELFGAAWLDITTGELWVEEFGDRERMRDTLLSLAPGELLLPEGEEGEAWEAQMKPLRPDAAVSHLPEWCFELDTARKTLCEFFHCSSLDSFGCSGLPRAVRAAGGVIRYLLDTQRDSMSHVRPPRVVQSDEFMLLDEVTRRNLELTTASSGKRRGSLLGVLDRAETAMGGRLLARWLNYPLRDVGEIGKRHAAVEELVQKSDLRGELRQALAPVADLERLNGRIAMGSASPRDLVALSDSLAQVALAVPLLARCDAPLLRELAAQTDPLEDVRSSIAGCLVEQPPLTMKEGGLVREGVNAELDELRSVSHDGKGWISRLEQSERERTGIPTLKIRYNKVFGYFIEVSKSYVAQVPEDFHRKQTISNGERYITPALKEYEEKVLRADERIIQLEYEIFQDLRSRVAEQGERLQKTAAALAAVDVLAALAEVAQERDYVRPQVDDGDAITIRDGRHPVVEALNSDERFVPNDVELNGSDSQILLITGPNMAGKSTYMRQVALIVLLAQAGSFVPAGEAHIGVVDRIFTRVGASDNLARGQSTFMVEMIETAHILHYATPKSLVVLDEIGRGTSTFDGLSIAWAVAEYLHNTPGKTARTLFATHYHELAELADTLPRIKNFNIAVREWNEQVVFLRRIVPGSASHSYGIQVARLAGLPGEVIARAREVLEQLESAPQDREKAAGEQERGRKSRKTRGGSVQLDLFGPPVEEDQLRVMLKKVDISVMTPLEALNFLDRLKKLV